MYFKHFFSFNLMLALVASTSSAQLYPFTQKQNAIRYSRLDVDIRDCEISFDDGKYKDVRKIYVNGKYAKPRTLKKLSTTANSVMKNEPTFKLFNSYWRRPKYADIAISQIINKGGPYNQQSQKFRADAGIKYIQYHSLWMWVIHQMELSIRQCRNNRKLLSIRNWDYAVADYMGSLIVDSEDNPGYNLHTLAIKRCSQFDKCTTAAGKQRARINNKIYTNFRQGKRLLQSKRCAQVNIRKNRIISFMYVPLIQGCIRYIAKTKKETGEDKQKSHAEAWAFCAAFLPKLASCNPTVAADIVRQLGPRAKNPMSGVPRLLISKIYRQLKCMGIKCVDLGSLNEFPEFNIPKCAGN